MGDPKANERESLIKLALEDQGGPARSTEVVAVYLYLEAFRYNDFGAAAATGWLMVVTSLLHLATAERGGEDSSLASSISLPPIPAIAAEHHDQRCSSHLVAPWQPMYVAARSFLSDGSRLSSGGGRIGERRR